MKRFDFYSDVEKNMKYHFLAIRSKNHNNSTAYRPPIFNSKFSQLAVKMVKIYNIINTSFFGNASISILKEILLSNLWHLEDKSILLYNNTYKDFLTTFCSL